MIIKETKEELKTGEILTVKVLQSPLEEYVDKLIKYRGDKMPWAIDNEKRFKGELIEECKDMFFVGEIKDEVVSLMWYTVSGDVGTYGLVSTKEEYRRRGIASYLMKHCLEFMDKEDGLLAMYLGVTNPIAKNMYEKYGWVSYNDCPNTCIMRRLTNQNISQEKFDEGYYRYNNPVKIRKVKRGDLPKVEALYNWTGNRWLIKDYPSGIFDDTAVESQIIALNNKVENNGGSFLCIENGLGRIVGVATLFDSNVNYQTHIKILDFFVHPNYLEYGTNLLISIIEVDKKRSERQTTSYLASSDKGKINLLKKLCFKKTGTIAGYFKKGEEEISLLVLTKGMEKCSV